MLTQAPERLAHAGVGGDDDVGPLGGDQGQQPPAAQRLEQPTAQAPCGRHLRVQPVQGVEEQLAGPRLHPRPAEHGAIDRPAHGEQPVLDAHVGTGALVAQSVGDDAGRKVVALADRRREDEHARRVHHSSMWALRITVWSSGRPNSATGLAALRAMATKSFLRQGAIPGASVGTIVMRERK